MTSCQCKDSNALKAELARQQQLLDNYCELLSDQADNESYVARGNGFCDAKYSDDFIEGQIEKIQSRINTITQMLSTL